MINVKNNFKNADEAFKYFYHYIKKYGIDFGDTKTLFNIGFYLDNPLGPLYTTLHSAYLCSCYLKQSLMCLIYRSTHRILGQNLANTYNSKSNHNTCYNTNNYISLNPRNSLAL